MSFVFHGTFWYRNHKRRGILNRSLLFPFPCPHACFSDLHLTITSRPSNFNNELQHPLKNIIFVCKQQRISTSTQEHHLGLQATMNVISPPPPPPPPLQTTSTPTEEHHLCLQITTNVISPPPPSKQLQHPPKNIIFVCKSQRTSLAPHPPPPHPPSKQLQHPPKNIIFVCKSQRTSLAPHPPSKQLQHPPKNIIFVCKSQRTSLAPHPPPNNFNIHRRTSSLFANHNERH